MNKVLADFCSDEAGATYVENAFMILFGLSCTITIVSILKTQIVDFATAIGPKIESGINRIS